MNFSPNPCGLLGGDPILEDPRVRMPSIDVVPFPSKGFWDEKSAHTAPPRNLKEDRVGRSSMVTPILAMRKKEVFAVEIQSPLLLEKSTLTRLPVVTPFAGRDRQYSKSDLDQSDQNASQQGPSPSERVMPDYQGDPENGSDSSWCIKGNVAPCETSIFVRDHGAEIRAKPCRSRCAYLIFLVSLFAFCLQIPKHVPVQGMPRGRRLSTAETGTFHKLLAEAEVFPPPRGFSVIGCESVSLVTLVLVAAIFGSS